MMARLLSLILLLILFANCSASAATTDTRQYTNPEYGYTLALPQELSYSETSPPAPQHGIAIALHDGAHMWIDGSYDAGFLGSAKAALLQLLIDENIHAKPRLTLRKLAGLTAVETSFRKDGMLAIRMIVFRPRGDAVPILYTLALDADASHAKLAMQKFRQMQSRFTLRDLPR